MMPERREAFLAALRNGPRTTAELRGITGFNKSTLLRYGRHLEEEGVVVRTWIPMPGMGPLQCMWRLARWTPHGSRAACPPRACRHPSSSSSTARRRRSTTSAG